MNNELQNIIWAVDPMAKKSKTLDSAKKAIRTWEGRHTARVVPVSLVTPGDLQWPEDISDPWKAKLRPLMEQSLARLLKTSSIKGLNKPQVLIHGHLTPRGQVHKMIDFASSEGADLIVVSHRGEKGWAGMGSFTQNLIELSTVPVLSVREDMRIPSAFKHLFFATDFSRASQKIYRKVLAYAKSFGARVTLFHRLDSPELVVAMMGGPVANYQNFMAVMTESNSRNQLHRGRTWQRQGKKLGVDVEFLMQKGISSFADILLRAIADSKPDLVVFGIEPHPIARSILGSSVRDALHELAVPVLLLPYRQPVKANKKSPSKKAH